MDFKAALKKYNYSILYKLLKSKDYCLFQMADVLLNDIIQLLKVSNPDGLSLYDICFNLNKSTTKDKCYVLEALNEGLIRNIFLFTKNKYRLYQKRRTPKMLKVSRTKDGKVHFVASHILLFDSYFLCCRTSCSTKGTAFLFFYKCRGRS